MKKKEYIEPTIKAFRMKTRHKLLAGSGEPSGSNVYDTAAEDNYETY